MAQNILLALQITFIGMGLVFGAILVLWALMAVMMQIAAFREKRERADHQEQLQDGRADQSQREQKKIAAAIAVALAISLSKENPMEPHVFPLPPTAIVSAWQAVMRAQNMNKRGIVR